MALPKYESLKDYLESQPRTSYLPTRHKKGWGYELWLANNELYCGKILVLQRRKKCSLHYHIKKDETFYVVKGLMQLHLIGKDGLRFGRMMNEGDTFHIPPGMVHQFEGIAEETLIVETSTQHFEDDSYRIERGD